MLLESIERVRIEASRTLDPEHQAAMGQFLTPAPVARLMASMLGPPTNEVRLLDPGAGVGSLTAAAVASFCAGKRRPRVICVAAYELDSALFAHLRETLLRCAAACRKQGIEFRADPVRGDFIEAAVAALEGELFERPARFSHVIMNPPYRKISSGSGDRLALRTAGIETSNLYSAFVALAVKLLEPGGELVAITPRSFCNGTYFKPFRQELLRELALRRIHVFDSRQTAFGEDGVLQENVILHGQKGGDAGAVTISSSAGPSDQFVAVRQAPLSAVVRPDDPEAFIHVTQDGIGEAVRTRMAQLTASLDDLQVQVSTGRVVDFRARNFLRKMPEAKTVPLIYPANFTEGFVAWPKSGRKPQAMVVLDGVEELLVPAGVYVLVKRFSSKEEKRRLVAAVYDPARVEAAHVGFENHLNYFHRRGRGLPMGLAKGLAVFLNSSLVDMFFRQFSGHTQVNAGDLRKLRFPCRSELLQMGSAIKDRLPSQVQIDEIVEDTLGSDQVSGTLDPVRAKAKIDEAIEILRQLGLPKEQQNERSALTLLALLGLKPKAPWSEAAAPLMGITPVMEFFGEHYGKVYAPNTRETVRRQTMHQFLDAGLVVINPDEPDRPTNSGKTVYQVESGLLELLRTWGTAAWEAGLATYLASAGTLRERYAQERTKRRIPVEIAPDKVVALSPGGQNILIEKIIQDFCQIFTPGAKIAYIGDTDAKAAYFDADLFSELGLNLDPHHGKMPDLVVDDVQRGWLVLVEAVTSHGPVNAKRLSELKRLFGGGRAGLVFVTAFLDRASMQKYLGEISWETEVWVAESPTHLIHFDGERYLGPYEDWPVAGV